jgi:hypothetical protein
MTKPKRRKTTQVGVPQPVREIKQERANDFERSQRDTPIDDPGDAQRASKNNRGSRFMSEWM